MNKIVSKEHFSANVVKLEVEAPLIARSRKAGHFVIVKVGEKGERIPLTIAGADTQKGTITLVIQAVGGSSKKICDLNVGDYITDLVGPLGSSFLISSIVLTSTFFFFIIKPSFLHCYIIIYTLLPVTGITIHHPS